MVKNIGSSTEPVATHSVPSFPKLEPQTFPVDPFRLGSSIVSVSSKTSVIDSIWRFLGTFWEGVYSVLSAGYGLCIGICKGIYSLFVKKIPSKAPTVFSTTLQNIESSDYRAIYFKDALQETLQKEGVSSAATPVSISVEMERGKQALLQEMKEWGRLIARIVSSDRSGLTLLFEGVISELDSEIPRSAKFSKILKQSLNSSYRNKAIQTAVISWLEQGASTIGQFLGIFGKELGISEELLKGLDECSFPDLNSSCDWVYRICKEFSVRFFDEAFGYIDEIKSRALEYKEICPILWSLCQQIPDGEPLDDAQRALFRTKVVQWFFFIQDLLAVDLENSPKDSTASDKSSSKTDGDK